METVAGAARLVEPTSLSQLAQALVEMLSNGAVRDHYSSVGRERAAEFTWERTARQTMDVYRHVCSEATGKPVA